MLRAMFMISSETAGSTVKAGALLLMVGSVSTVGGVFLAFNLRGAVDGIVRRRQILLGLRGAKTGNLNLPFDDPFDTVKGPWYLRCAGVIMLLSGVPLLLISFALLFSEG